MGEDNGAEDQTPAAVARLVGRETEVTFRLRALGASVTVLTLLSILNTTAVVASVAAGTRWGLSLTVAMFVETCLAALALWRLRDYDNHLREGMALYEEISVRYDALLRSPLSESDEVRHLGTSGRVALSAFHFGVSLPLMPPPGRHRYHIAYLVLDLLLVLAMAAAAAAAAR